MPGGSARNTTVAVAVAVGGSVGMGFFGHWIDRDLETFEMAADRLRVVEVFWSAPDVALVARAAPDMPDGWAGNNRKVSSTTTEPRAQKHPTGYGVMLLAVVVAIVVVVTFVAFEQRRSASPTVEVVGDSITFFASRDVTAALEPKYDSDVHADIGKRIDEMLPSLQAAVRRHPFAVVVNLGSNDARQAQTHPDWRSGFEQMTAFLIPMPCVLVTTINTGMDGQPGTNTVASEINQAIRATVSAHHNLHIVDWNAAVHGTNGTTLLTPDQIHPSAAGRLTLASLVRTALSANCRQP